jgi:N-acetylmuramoyl-L-alanine amidase
VFELTLALAPQDSAAFRAGARAGAEKEALAMTPLRESPAPEATPAQEQLPIVVLDPGHGGIDSGALGRDHVEEKDIVLAFAKVLGDKLRAENRYHIVFTRDDDTFVPLAERVRMARRIGAALFVSIHADTLRGEDPDVRGATVYTLSERASDAEAARVARDENKADAAAGVDDKPDSSDVNDILFDLTRRETRAYSNIFAHTLANYWKVAARLNKNPRRSAGFVVLTAPDVASVLLELGYLSNAKDVSDLTSPQWRDKATDQVAQAIDAYFAARPPEENAADPAAQGALKATQRTGN